MFYFNGSNTSFYDILYHIWLLSARKILWELSIECYLVCCNFRENGILSSEPGMEPIPANKRLRCLLALAASYVAGAWVTVPRYPRLLQLAQMFYNMWISSFYFLTLLKNMCCCQIYHFKLRLLCLMRKESHFLYGQLLWAYWIDSVQ